jgi:plastocyanin
MGNPLGSVSKAFAVLLVAWGCAPAAARAGDHPVTFPSNSLPAAYSPASIEAAIGDTVTFSGAFASHPLVWNDGDFTTQSTGTTRTYSFSRAGSFAFHCAIHASMVGSVHVAGDQLATPEFSWAPSSPKTGEAVTFSAGAFTDPDGTIARYEWDLDGNGSYETVGAAPAHTYATAGTVTVKLRYVDDGHETSAATAHALSVAQGPATGGGSTTPSPAPPTTPGSAPPGSGGTGGSTTAPGGDDQGAGPSSGGTTAPRVRLGARALTFRSGHARAAVTLSAAGSARATLKRGSTVLASGTATLGAGDGTVRLTITKGGSRALRRTHGGLRATLTVIVHRAGSRQTTTAKRTLTVKLG